MRHSLARRVGALGLCAAALTALAAGPSKEKANPAPKPKAAEVPLKGEETLGDLAYVQAATNIRVEGVGLVIGLDGTGGEPGASSYRQKILDGMRRARVPHAEDYLKSGQTAVVVVRGTIPVGIGPRDVFDVEVEVTPDSTPVGETLSLAGGRLMLTELRQVGVVESGELEGHVLATAFGPIMAGTTAQPDKATVGRLLGGARVKKEVPYTLVLKESRRSIKTAALVQSVVNRRYHRREGIDEKGLATAKSDQFLVLRVPAVYHQNQVRYFQVLQLLPVVETPELRAQRMARWARELLDPKTAGVAALKLEGIGRNAIDAIKPGLASPDGDVRFFAAEALAYLGDASGFEVLGRAAVARPAYRAFALAALAAMDQAAASIKLRELMAMADPQLRYGAFNALRTLNPDDPFLGRVEVLRDEAPEPGDDEDGEAMALRIASARRRGRASEPFALYVVDCDGPPMVHVAGSRRCEIVLFGKGQKLLTPAVLGGTGPVLVNAALGDDKVQVTRIAAGSLDAPEQKVTCPAALGEVIREAADLGATYPELVAILRAAEAQKNLPGPLVVDAVPAPRPEYEKAQLAGTPAAAGAKKDAAVGRAGHATPKPSPRRGLIGRWRGRRRGKD